MKRNHVWVVEALQANGRWVPMTSCVSDNRASARLELKTVKYALMRDKGFRLTKYTAEQSAGKG